MNAAALLILVLSNAGYWFGGEPAQVTLQWAVEPPAQAVFAWELRYGNTALGTGEVALPGGQAKATFAIETPRVRVRTPLQLMWRVITLGNDEAIDSGSAPVVLFPDDLLQPLPALLGEHTLLVLDDDACLPAVLDAADVPYQRLRSLDDLTLHRGGIALIGPDQVAPPQGKFAPSPLIDAARRGVRVMAFRQECAARLADLAVTPRLAPRALGWRSEHPLFRGLTAEDLASWTVGDAPVPAVRIGVDDPAMELAYWPIELAQGDAAPVDAAVLTRTVGDGRVVLWQLPRGPWDSDPRSQVLLLNAVDYLMTPLQPTPPPSARRKKNVRQRPEGDRP